MRCFGPKTLASKRCHKYRVRTIRKNFRDKPTYLFLTCRIVGSRRLQGILSPFLSPSSFDTEIKETSRTQAYVGGLFREEGMDIVKKWLDPLFRPLVDDAYQAERRDHLDPAAPAALTAHPVRQRRLSLREVRMGTDT
jgi:hypothetical protein